PAQPLVWNPVSPPPRSAMDVPTQELFPLRRVEALRPGDPPGLGPYVLLCRLPSGGMGADVFIARGVPPQGQHVVVKALPVGLPALADVHAARVAHRDVKPGNIIITPAKDVVLVDFGISRETDERGEFPQTESVSAVLTRQYAAPEQMQRAGTLTQAVDVFAWG